MKDLKSFGEYGLITHLTTGFDAFHAVHTGIGDDAAVTQNADGTYTIYTLDTLVEHDHFSNVYMTPRQIGAKAAESNISDIAAMGADPTYALLSVVLSDDTNLEWLEGVYAGLRESFAEHKVTLLGGDTTHGAVQMLSLTLLGATPKPVLRSGAKPGDLLCVTGQVGGSAAGWHMLKNGLNPPEYARHRHTNPRCRLGLSRQIRGLATSMIDISDGVGSEARHLAHHSGCGVVIYAEKLPVHPDVFAVETQLNLAPYTCAMSGGEDFELLFTVPEKDVESLKNTGADITVIGQMTTEKDQRDFVISSEKTVKMPHGYDHTQTH